MGATEVKVSKWSGECSHYFDLFDKTTERRYLLRVRLGGTSIISFEYAYTEQKGEVEDWRRSVAQRTSHSISEDLAIKTVLCFYNLLPAAIYADALQEQVPEAEWVAEILREWAKWAEK